MADDPKFAQTLSGAGGIRIHRRRATLAGLGFVLGLLLLIAGVQITPVISIVGFVVMLVSATVGLAAWRGRHTPVVHQQRGAEDQLLGFDDNPRRFDVIEGGRTKKPRLSRSGSRSARRHGNKAPKQGTFMQRMEQRWERRRQQGY